MKQFVMVAVKATREIEVIKDDFHCRDLHRQADDYYEVWKDLHRRGLAASHELRS